MQWVYGVCGTLNNSTSWLTYPDDFYKVPQSIPNQTIWNRNYVTPKQNQFVTIDILAKKNCPRIQNFDLFLLLYFAVVIRFVKTKINYVCKYPPKTRNMVKLKDLNQQIDVSYERQAHHHTTNYNYRQWANHQRSALNFLTFLQSIHSETKKEI